jgi:hypothetical protein
MKGLALIGASPILGEAPNLSVTQSLGRNPSIGPVFYRAPVGCRNGVMYLKGPQCV